MKIYFPFLVLLLLSACATSNNSGSAQMVLRIQYVGARADTMPVAVKPEEISRAFSGQVDQNKASFPLSYTVECNGDRTDCKHAVVRSDLVYSAQPLTGNKVRFTGVLSTELGRSLKQDLLTTPQFSMSNQSEVPAGVALIGEGKHDLAFTKIISLGESFTIPGLVGTSVTLSLLP